MFYILHTFLNNTQLQNRRIKGRVGTKASKQLRVRYTSTHDLTTTIIISFAAGSSTEDFAFACFRWRVLMDEHAGPCPAFYRWIYSLSMLAARWHSSCLHGLRSRLSSYLKAFRTWLYYGLTDSNYYCRYVESQRWNFQSDVYDAACP